MAVLMMMVMMVTVVTGEVRFVEGPACSEKHLG